MHHMPVDLLIVEDEPETRSLLAQIFRIHGYTVRTAADGFAALALIRMGMPNLILSDLNMPGMSGFELLSVVRRRYPDIYVVASSGAYAGSSVPHGIAADSYHEKATGVAALVTLLRAASERTSGWRRPPQTPPPLWVNLEDSAHPEVTYVFINCPECLRPFRQSVEKVNTEIRCVSCRYCGGHVEYAIALAIPPAATNQECYTAA